MGTRPQSCYEGLPGIPIPRKFYRRTGDSVDPSSIVSEAAAMAKRMFVAIDLPPEFADRLSELDPGLHGLRWLPASMRHLTLCFLAAVPEENEARLIKGLTEIHCTPFPMELKGLGRFGRRGHPSVVWARVESPAPELDHLHTAVRDAALVAGLEVERKPFHPHVTLGRCKGLADRDLTRFLERHRDSGFGSFTVTGFTLYHSTLRPEGTEHKPVFRGKLSTS